MLNRLQIEGDDFTPIVDFNPDEGVLKISGRSLLEDTAAFYEPLLDWIDKYLQNPKEKTLLVFELEYFNSSSAKMLTQIMMKFEPMALEDENSVKVIWRYKENDDIMYDRGKEFKSIVFLPFELEKIPA